jgi:type I restriction enzyme M protein
MFLHNINYDNFDIQLGDTLVNPLHRDFEPFDAIVSNPPYSIPWEGSKNPLLINDDRYAGPGVLAPDKTADLAFTLHMLASLSESGTAAIVEFPGVLYRGGKEQSIRKWLVENNYVDTIIQLPSNLFFGVGIATCIIVLRKSARPDNSILFIDASKDFVKHGNKNRLASDNQDHIFSIFSERKEEQYFSRLVTIDEVLKNEANLSVSSYVEQEDTREVIDIDQVNANLRNLIAEGNTLNARIEEIINELKGE